MNTTDILRECRRLPGVSVNTKEEYAELILSTESGNGRMQFVPLFEGVTLAVIEVHSASWPAPRLPKSTPDASGPLIINYCIRGRCELMLNDNRSVFLSAGHISLTEKFAQSQYIYPGGLYEGIELFIDPEAAHGGTAVLRDHFGLHIEELSKRYCRDGDTFIAELPVVSELLKKLYILQSLENPASGVGMKTGVIDLLAMLLNDRILPKEGNPVYYTRFQVEIARQIESTITADLSYSHTVRAFSEQFGISEGSVKNYFQGVFGQSISRYTTYKRMVYAAELLEKTNMPIIEIAGSVGYESQSKFASAFRREYGAAPGEYRKQKKLSGIFKP